MNLREDEYLIIILLFFLCSIDLKLVNETKVLKIKYDIRKNMYFTNYRFVSS